MEHDTPVRLGKGNEGLTGEKVMRADAQANRLQIVEAATRLIAEHGMGVSLRTVAQEAGVGIGTLYRHFPTRLDLGLGVMDGVAQRVEAIAGARDDEWAVEPARAWRACVTDLVAIRIGALVSQVASLRDELGDHVDHEGALAMRGRVLSAVEALLAKAKNAGLVDRQHTAEQFHIGLAVIGRPMPEPVEEDVAQVRTWLVGTYLRGLRPITE